MAEKKTEDNNAQKKYLLAKIEELTDSVAPGYGEAFLDELMLRLHNTVTVFNDELFALIEQLKSNSVKRNKMMENIFDKKEINKSSEVSIFNDPLSNAMSEMSEWEKKLEDKKAKVNNNVESDNEKPKKRKRSIFKRKK
tara:strand:+ start:1175 stop:1591 length:417 start_codon:yes stop_codon:yes gene_type:complete